MADAIRSPSTSALKGMGVAAMSRYLSWTDRDSIGKVIGPVEYGRLIGDGVGVLLNWEYAATDWMGGATAGKAHGEEAVRQARRLGHPPGRAIIGSADMDMTATQWTSAGRGYAVAFATAVRAGGYVAGVYGPWDVLDWCFKLGMYGVFWQSMSTAFSGRRNAHPWPGAHLRQTHQQTIGGVGCDLSQILIDPFGQHQPGVNPPVEVADVTPDQATSLSDINVQVNRLIALTTPAPLSSGSQPNNLAAAISQMQAAVAGLVVQVTALTAAMHTIITAGGNADTTTIITAINTVGQKESAAVRALQQQLAAAALAAGNVLGQQTPDVP